MKQVQQASDDDELVDRACWARMANVDPSTVKRWDHRGIGPVRVELSPGVVRYRKGDLRAFIRARTVGRSKAV